MDLMPRKIVPSKYYYDCSEEVLELFKEYKHLLRIINPWFSFKTIYEPKDNYEYVGTLNFDETKFLSEFVEYKNGYPVPHQIRFEPKYLMNNGYENAKRIRENYTLDVDYEIIWTFSYEGPIPSNSFRLSTYNKFKQIITAQYPDHWKSKQTVYGFISTIAYLYATSDRLRQDINQKNQLYHNISNMEKTFKKTDEFKWAYNNYCKANSLDYNRLLLDVLLPITTQSDSSAYLRKVVETYLSVEFVSLNELPNRIQFDRGHIIVRFTSEENAITFKLKL